MLREWFGAVSDFSKDCEGGVAKNSEDATANAPIIREVGCDEEGADFNYKIKVGCSEMFLTATHFLSSQDERQEGQAREA